METNGGFGHVARAPSNMVDEAEYISSRGKANARDRFHNPLWEVMADEWDPDLNQDGYVNLSVAENTLLHPEIEEHIQNHVKTTSQTLRYGKDGFLGSSHLRTSVATFLTRWMKPAKPITAEQVVITSGVTNAIETCAWTLLDAGDAIMIGRPYYIGFSMAFAARADVKVLPVSFGEIDPFSLEGVRQYEKCILKARERNIKVKGVLLCSPHNPLGRCYPKETLIAFMHLCQKYSLHLISDEIYALSVWENEAAMNTVEYTSVLEIDKAKLVDPCRVHALWGISKDFGLNGLRIGCIISQDNQPFLAALKNVSLFMGPSSMADDAAASILSDARFADRCVTTSRRRLASSYALAVNYLRAYGIKCHQDNNAGLFLWAKLENGESASRTAGAKQLGGGNTQWVPVTNGGKVDVYKEPANMMHQLLMNGVMLNGGDEYDAEEGGWFRIVFSHTDEYLMKGLERVVRTVLERHGQLAELGNGTQEWDSPG